MQQKIVHFISRLTRRGLSIFSPNGSHFPEVWELWATPRQCGSFVTSWVTVVVVWPYFLIVCWRRGSACWNVTHVFPTCLLVMMDEGLRPLPLHRLMISKPSTDLHPTFVSDSQSIGEKARNLTHHQPK